MIQRAGLFFSEITEAEFQRQVKRVESLPYRQRRAFLRLHHYPLFVYKYRFLDPSDEKSVNRLRDIIVRSQFWFSSPRDFNDPFDLTGAILFDGNAQQSRKRLDQILMKRGLRSHERKKVVNEVMSRTPSSLAANIQALLEEFMSSVGVCSFAGDPCSIQMWSHYASNHQGICVQFETARDPRTFFTLLPVDYSDEYPLISWLDTTESDDRAIAMVRTKHTGWAYEGEARLIAIKSANQFRPFRPFALRSVIFGCRIAKNVEACVKDLLTERRGLGLPMPDLYRAFKHSRKYKVLLLKEAREIGKTEGAGT
jgi:hypothetical protein